MLCYVDVTTTECRYIPGWCLGSYRMQHDHVDSRSSAAMYIKCWRHPPSWHNFVFQRSYLAKLIQNKHKMQWLCCVECVCVKKNVIGITIPLIERFFSCTKCTNKIIFNYLWILNKIFYYLIFTVESSTKCDCGKYCNNFNVLTTSIVYFWSFNFFPIRWRWKGGNYYTIKYGKSKN